MPAQVVLKALGLLSSPNQLGIPEGALSLASNIIVKRDDIIEQRRGFKLYGTQTATLVKQLFTYKNRILRHFGSTLQFDTEILNANEESVFSSFAGTFSETQTGLRVKSVESNGNFYFTTSDGIKKISASDPSQLSTASGYITNAGGVKAINGTARIDFRLGQSDGFLPEDSAVAYRFVWGINDANNNLILGTPSERVVLYSPLLNFLIPDFDRVLGALDDITETTTTAFINNDNYVSTLNLQNTATPTDVQTQIIALAKKIDEDILYANFAATAPLGIVSSIVASGVATITLSGVNPNLYWTVGSKINLAGFSGAASGLNGPQTVVATTATTVTFNTTAVVPVTAATGGELIESYEYRYAISTISYNNAIFDLNAITINNPATNTQLNVLQGAISAIIARLQDEPITVISALNQTAFVESLDVTSSTNVILNVNIPQDITSSYFLQIYRSDISTATGVGLLSDLTPNDEMQLVYEASPTSAELIAGTMIVLDEVFDAFAGANLYTNPSTGEGILQSNDVPPLSKDINRFKNVVFYANTKTRQRLNFNLLGVTNFKAGNISTFSAGAPSTITTDAAHGLVVGDLVYINGTGNINLDTNVHKVLAAPAPTATTFAIAADGLAGGSIGYWTNAIVSITDSGSARNYYFIKEMAEVTNIATIADVADSLNGDYFTINSGKDETEYYVWYKTGAAASDPAPAGKTGIQVTVATNATANDVALATRDILSRYPQNWNISGITNNVIVTNVTKGVTDDATAATSGFTITFPQQGRGEDSSIQEVLLSSAVSPAQAVDASARSFQNVVNRNPAENVYIYYLSGLSDIPGKMLIEGRNLSATKFYIAANTEAVGDSFDPPVTPEIFITANSVATETIITTASPHGLVSGNSVIISFSNSTPSINGLYTITNLSPTTFSIPVMVTVAGSSGTVVNSTDSVTSDNEQKVNRVYFSKLSQPEAVPLVNYFDVGSQEKEILRIYPLRDSLFVFKQDGLFRISGEGAPFNLALYDSTCGLVAADSIGELNNQLYCWADEGIQAVSESGVDTISRNIDNQILKLASATYTNFSTVTWGIGYQSDQAYIVYTNSETTDEVATLGYRYNLLTGAWTTIDRPTTCGIVNSKDDRLYTGAGDLSFIEQERKNFDRTDYADRQWVKTLGTNAFTNNGKTLKLSSISNITAGDVIVQEQYITVSNFNALLLKLDLDAKVAAVPIVSISTGSSPLITVKNLQFVPGDVNIGTDTITVTAHGFTDGQKVRFESTGTIPAGISANTDYLIDSSTANTFKLLNPVNLATIDITSVGAGTHTVFLFHNLVVGDFVTLSGTNCDPNLDGNYEVITTPTGYSYTIIPADAITTAGNSGTSRYDYFLSQEMVGGDDIRIKLVNLATKLNTDPGTKFVNYLDIIASIGPLSTIISNTAASPTIITTSTPHGLQNGRYISISGTNSTPTFDGNYEVTLLTPTTFSVPVSIQIGGTTGTFTTLTSDFRDLKACFNAIVTNLNLDPNVIFNNYNIVTLTTSFEDLVTSVNSFTNEVTTALGIDYLVGNLTVYNAIESILQYTPQTMGDPLGWKHMTNFTMMFENKAFTEATVSFASDLLPEFIEIKFQGDGNGIFGYANGFGSGFFGGGSHGAPFRTYFPRQVMRCRYFLVRFKHRIARESYSIYGTTSEGSISLSTRAYR